MCQARNHGTDVRSTKRFVDQLGGTRDHPYRGLKCERFASASASRLRNCGKRIDPDVRGSDNGDCPWSNGTVSPTRVPLEMHVRKPAMEPIEPVNECAKHIGHNSRRRHLRWHRALRPMRTLYIRLPFVSCQVLKARSGVAAVYFWGVVPAHSKLAASSVSPVPL